ncbi:UNVERIFIED_CONTAM: Presequence protease, mitochondrial [Siphonaria sp. JEL0065]|nr:Presequence protease, mitochondrial [Siphonaria sp. JEL0065]
MAWKGSWGLRSLHSSGRRLSARHLVGDLQVGTIHHGFKVTKVLVPYRFFCLIESFIFLHQIKDIPDFALTAIQLKHQVTGADYLHIAKDDSNNVFTVGFQTTPMDSTGVPHILEHTTLCGSQKFPVRDPFFKMLNRSMSTFMNALTGSDLTMYPFSTENPTDFNNLFSVYMDAVFHPLLRRLDFKQEGWRLEHEVPTDASTPIVFKGVVYNEMKGVFSDVNNIYLTRLQQAMYPETTYGHVSGGDPVNITDLTYEQLVAFHRKYYHPSNAKFVTYGNFPLLERLAAVDKIISPFGRVELEPITDVQPFNEPRRVTASCSPDAMGSPEKQCKLSISYLTNDGTVSHFSLCPADMADEKPNIHKDPFETFAVRMLTTLLTDGPSSPMYRALIETNIGTDYAASTGYDRTAKMTNFSVGLQGISQSDFSLVESKIKQVFQEAAKTGFEELRVESAIHQLELGIRHRRGNFGMGLSQSAIQNWIHGGEPIDALDVTKFITRLRPELKTPGFFESRIEKYFLQNKHQLVFTMEPTATFASQVESEEQERLARKVAALSDWEKDEIVKDGVKLKEMQETKEDPSCLPTLTLADVPVKGKTYPVSLFETEAKDFPLHFRETATNGITYMTVTKSLEGMNRELFNFLPLYSSALTALGTKETPSVPELDDKIRLTTSGITSSPSIQTSPTTLTTHSSTVHFGTSFLDPLNTAKAFSLFQQVIQGPPSTFSQETRERLRTVIAGIAANGMNSLADSGHRYAIGICGAGLTAAAKVKQSLGGLESVMFMNKLHEMGDDGVELSFGKIQEITRFVLEGESRAKGILITGADAIEGNKKHVSSLVSGLGWSLPKAVTTAASPTKDFIRVYQNTFVPLPFSVNYTGRAYLGVPYTHRDSPALQILAELMTSHFLHREVREKGGAYGGFGSYNNMDGLFSMASYRDPPGAGTRTLDAYDRGAIWGSEITKHLGQRELNEAKLSILSSLDAPISASQEGMTFYGTGLTDEARQTRRELILEASLEKIQEVAQQYIASQPYTQAVLGPSSEGLGAEGWNVIDMQK